MLTEGKVHSTNMEQPVPGYEADYDLEMVKLNDEAAATIIIL